MENGIVFKVWNIQGNTSFKTASSQLNDSIGYILNEEKTECSLEMDIKEQLNRECKYVENDIKTMGGTFVGSVNLASADIQEAVNEMMEVKKFYNKTDGRAALHGIISLPEMESSNKNASLMLQLCEDVMKELFPNHQSVFAVHTNTENLHVHFIVNSVGLDGKKIHQNDKFMTGVAHPCVNKYARKYGFTPNEKWEKEYGEYKKSYVELKIMLRNAIDQAIEHSNSFDDFIRTLNQNGYQVNVGKYISLKNEEMNKAIRSHTLGWNYTKDSIVERIAIRQEKMANRKINDYAMGYKPEDAFTYKSIRMRKYKDMPQEQKEYIVKMLKMGRNPWREHQQASWQLNNIVNQINFENRVNTYVEYYSKDKTLQGAMDRIIEMKKQISQEKKLVIAQKRRYKPIIDIYNEMKLYERKAYLYEYENRLEYRADYEKYRELTRSLKSSYNTDIKIVASFLKECDEQIIYANAQLNELSKEYKEIRKYAIEHGKTIESDRDIVSIMGLNENINPYAPANDFYYIASRESEIVLRVMRYAEMRNGQLEQGMEVVVVSKTGDTLERINTKQEDFKEKVVALEDKYSLNDCKRFANVNLAREFQNEKKITQKGNKIKEEGRMSFTQAINQVFQTDNMIFVADSKANQHFVMVLKMEDRIKLIVFEDNKKIAETVTIPVVQHATQDGYKAIIDLQNRYGFSDKVYPFEDEENLRTYMATKNAGHSHGNERNKRDWR